jgi:hypothetical protein
MPELHENLPDVAVKNRGNGTTPPPLEDQLRNSIYGMSF